RAQGCQRPCLRGFAARRCYRRLSVQSMALRWAPPPRTYRRSLIRSRRWLAATVRLVCCPHGALLDPLFVVFALQDVLHENARRDDVVWVDGAGLDQVLHFGDGDARGGRHHGIEVARRSPIDEITRPIAFPRLDEGEVGAQRFLEDVRLAVDGPRLLALG